VTKVVLVAGSHKAFGSFPKSSIYINTVRDFFYHQGFEVEYRIGNPPDADFLFMVRAKYFVQSGGGYSALAAEVNRRMRGTVLCSSGRFKCSLMGTVTQGTLADAELAKIRRGVGPSSEDSGSVLKISL